MIKLVFHPIGKILCLFLCVVMLAQLLPLAVFAESLSNSDPAAAAGDREESQPSVPSAEKDPFILREITEERDASVKRFLRSDGTFLAVSYPQPVHFATEAGWTEYDNRLVLGEDGYYTNQSSDQKVRVAPKNTEGDLFSIAQEGVSLSWRYEGSNEASIALVEKDEKAEGDDRFLALPNASQEAWFYGLYEETDLQFILSPVGIKENVILTGKGADSEWIIRYRTEGLSADQKDDGIHIFDGEGEDRFVLSAPCAVDAKGECCDLQLKLLDADENSFSVQLSLDREWFSAADRALPVTVDPVLLTSQAWGVCTSGFVAENTPNTAYTGNGSLYMGYMIPGNRGRNRSYLRCNTLPAFTTADVIVDARVNLLSNSNGNTLPFEVREVLSSWNISTLTWNNRPQVGSVVLDYREIPYMNNGTHRWFSWEITSLVKKWVANTSPNYGIEFRASNESSNMNGAWFYSAMLPNGVTMRPCLTVTYRNRSGFEDHLVYVGTGTGFGAVSVDPYNGNLIYSQDLTESLGGELLPVSISLTYNSNASGRNYNNVGRGMQINFHQLIHTDWRIAASDDPETQKYRYYYMDGDGTCHYFYFANASDTQANDEDGLGYQLSVNESVPESSVAGVRYTLTDKDKNTLSFNGYGQLLKLEASNHQSVNLSYALPEGGSVPQITQIADGAGRAYTFTLANGYIVTAIHDPAGRTTSLSYSADRLASITMPDGSVTSFTYNSNYLLNSITSRNGNTIYCTTSVQYEQNTLSTVKSITAKTAQNEIMDAYTFAYRTNETDVGDLRAVLNNEDYAYTMQFNDFGQCTGVVSSRSGQAQFFTFGTGSNGAKNKLVSASRTMNSTKNYLINGSFFGALSNSANGNFMAYIEDPSNGSIVQDTTKGVDSSDSVKITKNVPSTGRTYALQEIHVSPGTYTLSAFANTFGETLPGDGAKIALEVWQTGVGILAHYDTVFSATDGWERFSVTVRLGQNCYLKAVAGFDSDADEGGVVWFDNIQLEPQTGETAFNLLDNGTFSQGTSGWWNTAGTFSAVSLSSDELPGLLSAGRLTASTAADNGSIRQGAVVYGAKGDSFVLSAWAKAASAPTDDGTRDGDTYQPCFALKLQFYDRGTLLGEQERSFNPDVDSWQFLSLNAIAPAAYTWVNVILDYTYNANDVRFTGVSCTKEEFGQSFVYDSDGNVTGAREQAQKQASFAYYGNQMTKLLSPTGSRYFYTYDSENKLQNALSTDGQQYRFTYDAHGNLTESRVDPLTLAASVQSGKTYYVINAYSGQALTARTGSTIVTDRFDPGSDSQKWTITGSSDTFTLKNGSLYAAVNGNSGAQGATLSLEAGGQSFRILKKQEGSFGIFTASSSYEKCLDGQLDTGNTIVEQQEVKQALCSPDNLPEGMRWLFFDVSTSTGVHISSSASYSADGNWLTGVTDERGNTTAFSYDGTGRLTGKTFPNGSTETASYNASNNLLTGTSHGGSSLSYSYDGAHRLTAVETGSGLAWSFQYDSYGRRTKTLVGGTELAETTYDAYSRPTVTCYGNNASVTTLYDSLDRVLEVRYNNSVACTCAYNDRGALSLFNDYLSGVKTEYVYDLIGRVREIREWNTLIPEEKQPNQLLSSIRFTYDDQSDHLTGIDSRIQYTDGNNTVQWYEESLLYTFGDRDAGQSPDRVYSVTRNDTNIHDLGYDSLGRVRRSFIGGAFYNMYIYGGDGDATGSLIKRIRTATERIIYSYDAMGNITREIWESREDGSISAVCYSYDVKGQLTRADFYPVVLSYDDDVSFTPDTSEYEYETYSYDADGNILSKTRGVVDSQNPNPTETTTVYSYASTGWTDLLTGVGNQTISYDAIGNPTSYLGKSLTWENGRTLASFDDVTFTYDASGKRLTKGDVRYYYRGDVLAGEVNGSNEIFFLYGVDGEIVGCEVNGEPLYYEKNAQGDVITLLDEYRNVVGSYRYDPWGKILSVTGSYAALNPIRYRGYYYDSETGLYYCQSRYYDPAVGRWLNADSLLDNRTTLSVNLFVYCGNNPVNCVDSEGNAYHSINFFRETHQEVLCRISLDVRNKHLELRVGDNYIPVRGQRGFCDLYSLVTEEVWELKYVGVPRSKAISQLNRYMSAPLKHHNIVTLHAPKTRLPSGHFRWKDDNGLPGWVEYCDTGDGVLRYIFIYDHGDPDPARELRTRRSLIRNGLESYFPMYFSNNKAPSMKAPAISCIAVGAAFAFLMHGGGRMNCQYR